MLASRSCAGTFGLNAWVAGRNAALSAAEYMTPVLAESQFTEKGVLTPDEFVAAGDMLVLRCPTWQWQAGDPAKARPFLPPNKQFLLTKNVPCQKRASSLAIGAHEERTVHMGGEGERGEGDDDDEGWQVTHASRTAQPAKEAEILDIGDAVGQIALGGGSSSAGSGGGGSGGGGGGAAAAAAAATSSAEGALEAAISGVSGGDDDPSALGDEDFEMDGFDAVLKTRTYDVSITYDKYYPCARVWLYGYSEARQPLSQPEILQDISVDHALKTVTLESHPHIPGGAGLHASIHPCKHAQVMQKLSAELASGGRAPKVESYLFLFLKFISSVCPTIEYDYTLAVD